jgi:hypothetical protein
VNPIPCLNVLFLSILFEHYIAYGWALFTEVLKKLKNKVYRKIIFIVMLYKVFDSNIWCYIFIIISYTESEYLFKWRKTNNFHTIDLQMRFKDKNLNMNETKKILFFVFRT